MDKIRNYIEAIFSGMPKTKELVEIKLNMLDNIEEKYNQLISDGKSENETIGIIISSIGTAEDIIAELGSEKTILDSTEQNSHQYTASDSGEQNSYQYTASDSAEKNNSYNKHNQDFLNEYYAYKKKEGLHIAASVFLYILSPVVFILTKAIAPTYIALATFFIIIGIATANIIMIDFAGEKFKSIGQNQGDNIGFDSDTPFFATSSQKRLYSLVSSFLWCIITTIYLILGFSMGWWHPGWIIFVFGAALDSLIKFFISTKSV